MSVIQKLASGTWRRYSADDGGYYYHNEESDQSVWDPPQGWVEEAPPGGGAMDSLGADGKTVPRSSSGLSSVVADKPNRPAHNREASQDTTMSPGEVQSMKREAAGSSVSVTTPVVRTQQQTQPKSSSYSRDDDPRPLCACCTCPTCGFGCCVVVLALLAVVIVVVLASVLTLPQTVSCKSSEQGYFVVGYDGPNLTSIAPAIICTTNPVNVTFTGSGWVKFNSQAPKVTVGSWSLDPNPNSLVGCTDLDVRKQDVQTCQQFVVQFPSDPTGAIAPNSQLTITNPGVTPHPAAKVASDGCKVVSQALLLVRSPNVTSISPPGVCSNTVGVITLSGGPFFAYQITNTSQWVKPMINLASSSIPPDAITPTDCTPLRISGYNNATVCNSLAVQITANLYSASNTFQVQNPANVDCGGSTTKIFRIIPPSTITSASPNAICWRSGSTPVTLYGNFLQVDGAAPSFSIDGVSVQATLSNCTSLPADFHNLQQCSMASVTISPVDRTGSGLTYYTPVLTVANAIPGCISNSTPIATVPSPIIDNSPPGLPAICNTGTQNDQTVVISGSFLVANSTKPSFQIGTYTFDPSRVNPLLCNPANVPGVSLCAQFSITVPNTTIIGAPNPIIVTYPPPFSVCTSTSNYSVFSANPPSLTTVTPNTVALATPFPNITLAGTFQTWNPLVVPTVHVGTSIQRNIQATGCTGGPPQTCTALVVTLNTTGFTAGTRTVTVDAGSCTTTPGQIITFN